LDELNDYHSTYGLEQVSHKKVLDLVHDENHRINFGYITLKGGELKFCERVFSAGVSDGEMVQLMRCVAKIAERYRLRFVGE
jgi:hypothetical protein